MKKALIIILVILAVAGVVYAGYTLSSKKSGVNGIPSGGLPEPTPITLGEEPSGEQNPNGSVAGPVPVGNELFSFFSVASDTSVIATGLDGKIFQVAASGSATPLSASALEDFVSAAFSYDSQKIVLAFGSADNRQFSVFDVKTRSWTPLPLGVVSAVWKPQSHTLAYAAEKNGLKTIFSLDMGSPKAKPAQLFSLRIEDLVLEWPTTNKISVAQKPSGFVPQTIFLFDVSKKTFSSPVIDAPGAMLVWDSTASRALEFFGNQIAKGGTFRIISAAGETINKFQFLTLPEKCIFVPEVLPTSTVATSTKTKAPLPVEEKSIICAIPSEQSSLAQKTIPDEYYKRSFFTSDNIYKIDLEDGVASLLFGVGNKEVDVQNIFLAGNKLFFLNRADNKIYSLSLSR